MHAADVEAAEVKLRFWYQQDRGGVCVQAIAGNIILAEGVGYTVPSALQSLGALPQVTSTVIRNYEVATGTTPRVGY